MSSPPANEQRQEGREALGLGKRPTEIHLSAGGPAERAYCATTGAGSNLSQQAPKNPSLAKSNSERVISPREPTEFLEAPDHKYILEPDNPRLDRNLNYIEMFEIKSTNWEGKFKLSQDKKPSDTKAARKELIRANQESIRQFLDRVFKKEIIKDAFLLTSVLLIKAVNKNFFNFLVFSTFLNEFLIFISFILDDNIIL